MTKKAECIKMLYIARSGTHDFTMIYGMEMMANIYIVMPADEQCRKALKYRVRLMDVASVDVCNSLEVKEWKEECNDRL